jgi:hypothetical protein
MVRACIWNDIEWVTDVPGVYVEWRIVTDGLGVYLKWRRREMLINFTPKCRKERGSLEHLYFNWGVGGLLRILVNGMGECKIGWFRNFSVAGSCEYGNNKRQSFSGFYWQPLKSHFLQIASGFFHGLTLQFRTVAHVMLDHLPIYRTTRSHKSAGCN